MAKVTIPVVSVFLIVAVMAVSSFAASFTKGKPCPDGKFFDHGTELCEPCIGICQNANLTDMVEPCQKLCPATYVQLSSSQKQPERLALSLKASDDQQSATTPSLTGPSVALVAGVIAGIVMVSFLIIVGAFVCKRVQDNADQNHSGGGGGGGGNGGGQQAGSAERGLNLNRSRQGYSRAGVQEENGEQAEGGERRPSQGMGLRGYCDPRHWFAAPPEVPAEETQSGRQGTQEIALLGNSQGSVVQDLSQQPKTVLATPIYKPSGSMRSTVTRI